MLFRIGAQENRKAFLQRLQQHRCPKKSFLKALIKFSLFDHYRPGIYTRIYKNFIIVFCAGEDDDDFAISHPERPAFYGKCFLWKGTWYLVGFCAPSLLWHLGAIVALLAALNMDYWFAMIATIISITIVIMGIIYGDYRRIIDFIETALQF